MKRRKRVYVAGQITGTHREKYLTKFAQAEYELKKAGYDVVNPAKICDKFPPMEHGEYMRITVELLKMCEYILVIDGRNDSVGVQEEIIVAQKEGIQELVKVSYGEYKVV